MSNNLLVRLQIQQPLRKPTSTCLVVSLVEDADRTAKGNLQMRWSKIAVGKVGSQLEVSFDIIRIRLVIPTALELYRDSQKIFAGIGNCVAPLHRQSQQVIHMFEREYEPAWLHRRSLKRRATTTSTPA